MRQGKPIGLLGGTGISPITMHHTEPFQNWFSTLLASAAHYKGESYKKCSISKVACSRELPGAVFRISSRDPQQNYNLVLCHASVLCSAIDATAGSHQTFTWCFFK